MKKVNVKFEQKDTEEDITVTITASEKDGQVLSLMGSIVGPLAEEIMVHDSKGVTRSLRESSLISISTDNRKLKVVSDDGVFELDMPLHELEEQLDEGIFMRISRYEIINLNKVDSFSFPISGSLEIEMTNGMKTWASRRFISKIKDRLMKGGR